MRTITDKQYDVIIQHLGNLKKDINVLEQYMLNSSKPRTQGYIALEKSGKSIGVIKRFLKSSPKV
tara:strand:- start:629 stop:823 length:195 start_codon:yes stop_codon:yes gene_type:complete